MDQLVTRQDHGPVVSLTLNRPEKLNALSPALIQDLRVHLEAIAAAGPAVRCVVLQGAGRSFCAGADIEALRAGVVTDDPEFRSKTVQMLGDLGPVVIAAVHGHCYTGGLELALAADVIVAADDTRFRDTHALLGIVPRWGMSARLPRRVGLAVARRISTTCEVVPADEALRIGLCDYVVQRADLADFATEMAQRVAAAEPAAVAGIRQLYDHASGLPMPDALDYERAFSPTPPAQGQA